MSDDNPCQMLDWDSQFFGARIACVKGQWLTRENIVQIMRWCEAKQVDCLYFLCAPDNDESVVVAETHGFHLVDLRVEMHWRAQAVSASSPAAVRHFQEADLPELQQIAATAYTDTRFYYDRHFTNEQAAKLYREWITKSVRACGATDAVLIAPHQDGVGGFITCRQEPLLHLGRIGLVGVRADARGCGYGHALVQAARQYFYEHGVKEVYVVTQGRNIAAQRLYQAQGFRMHTLGLWYHKWFER